MDVTSQAWGMGLEMYPGTMQPAAPNTTSPELNLSHLLLGAALANGTGELSEHQQYVIGLFLSCLYTIFLFPIGFVGNILILVVNISFREKMTIPDLYFINLAVADLILVADSLIEVFNLHEQYYDIAVLCTFMSLFLQVNMYSSVFFLTWMSFDRYIALARAMRCSLFRTKYHARLSCGLIWMASVSATLVPFTAVHLQHTDEACFCFADVREVQWLEVTLGFIVPFAIIGLCYSLIVRVLVRAHRHRGLRPRRQKALRMILAVVLVFFVCWLPENVFISVHLLQRTQPGAAPCKQSFRHAHPLTGHIVNLAAFSNSCLNPLIYSFLGETFREKLRLYIEQKTNLPALNRFCHAALKAVIPDSTEQSDVRFSSAV
ncbi:G-protein coupled estrogen receptor 1 [Papio anubis]|uniref:G-protein coupled estrogen receptor 1 n=1 Tax=Papio anubis TaxID=9555 RepID=A0A096N0M3_PAPAN|nr:G-protein coupled estrogen receptor 1 [Papio anubis]XP_009200733.1 G-protein coupled estrogen receptor 1 [Papio anubis]XP_031521505.1 G-protein coupled estrogen receptor 1 [Papio anubis]